MLLQGNHTTSKGRSREKEEAKVNKFQGLKPYRSLDLHRPHTPAVGTLVADTGEERDAVLHCPAERGGICLLYLAHADHGVGPGPSLGGKGDGIPSFQGVDLSKVAICPSVVPSDADVTFPDGSVLKVPGTLGESFTVCALVDLHVYPKVGDLDPA